MNTLKKFQYHSPLGVFTFEHDGTQVVTVLFPQENSQALPDEGSCFKETSLKQLDLFFSGEAPLKLPVALPQSQFAREVVEVMMEIPPGATLTYKQLAESTSSPSAYRAVGSVCSRNPIPLLIPCHRVTASTSLGNYRGGAEMKEALVRFEKQFFV